MSWHSLLAPLPGDAVVKTQPVASPELAATVDVSTIAGWTQVTCELSAGEAGLRHVMVTLDETGRPISAGDHVLRCSPADGGLTRFEHESIGGRLEEDGGFVGTYHWTVYVQPDDSDAQTDPTESSSRKPTDLEIAALHDLVASLLRGIP